MLRLRQAVGQNLVRISWAGWTTGPGDGSRKGQKEQNKKRDNEDDGSLTTGNININMDTMVAMIIVMVLTMITDLGPSSCATSYWNCAAVAEFGSNTRAFRYWYRRVPKSAVIVAEVAVATSTASLHEYCHRSFCFMAACCRSGRGGGSASCGGNTALTNPIDVSSNGGKEPGVNQRKSNSSRPCVQAGRMC